MLLNKNSVKTFRRSLNRNDYRFLHKLIELSKERGYTTAEEAYPSMLGKLYKSVKGYYAFLKRLEFHGFITLENGKIIPNKFKYMNLEKDI